MKRCVLFVIATVVSFLLPYTGYSQTKDTILIDFGDIFSPLPWNNVSDPVGGTILNLIDQKENATEYTIEVIDPFNNINRNGMTITDPSIDLPPTVTGDSFFGNVAVFGGQSQPTGGIRLKNLNPELDYFFEIFGSREATDNRETKFVGTGSNTDSSLINTASNTADLATFTIKPDENGEITIIASPGPNNNNPSQFFYMGGIRMSYPEQDLPPVVVVRDSILIDFGDNLSGSPWIDVIDPVGAIAENLLTKTGKQTGYRLAVTDAFNNINRAGTLSPDPGIGFPPTATADSFFGNVATFGGQVQPTGAVSFSNLNPAVEYTFSIIASRDATDNREAKYLLQGEKLDSVFLDASSNKDKVAIAMMKPDVSGQITITVSPGPNNNNSSGFYYLGAMIISYEDKPFPSPFDTISLDFGTLLSPGPWINVENFTDGNLEDLVTGSGVNSGYGLRITDAFNGVNTAGTTAANQELGIPPTASGDSFFGNTVLFGGKIEETGGFELYNLDIEKEYTLSIFASRVATDNREAKYEIKGKETRILYLDASSNTENVVIATLKPDENGVISITASPGPNNNNASGFYYLGSMKLIFARQAIGVEEVSVIQPNGGEFWQTGKQVAIKWSSRNIPEVKLDYSIDGGIEWKEIGKTLGAAGTYNWTVPNDPGSQALVRVSGNQASDQSDAFFEISSETSTCRIVVLGSSTAEGAGATPRDSSWVNRYAASLANNTAYEVINLGKGGYTTFHILPTGTVSPGVSIGIDQDRNITKALSYEPYAIIVNMPSNDATNNFSMEQQMNNFDLISQAATNAGAQIFITTTQPRNFTNPSQIQIQKEVKDAILSKYGDHAIDFWTGIADENGFIQSDFDSGDGIHLNNIGHRILFERVRDTRIDTLDCFFTNINDPVNPIHQGIKLYPNPSNGSFSIEVKNPEYLAGIEMWDLVGRKVYEKREFDLQNKMVNIRLQSIENGLYFCAVYEHHFDGFRRTVIPFIINL